MHYIVLKFIDQFLMFFSLLPLAISFSPALFESTRKNIIICVLLVFHIINIICVMILSNLHYIPNILFKNVFEKYEIILIAKPANITINIVISGLFLIYTFISVIGNFFSKYNKNISFLEIVICWLFAFFSMASNSANLFTTILCFALASIVSMLSLAFSRTRILHRI